MKFNIKESEKNMAGIYIITAKDSNDFYIGSTDNFFKRYKGYVYTLKDSFYMSRKMASFVDKVGYNNIIFSKYVSTDRIYILGVLEKFIIQNIEPTLNTPHNSRKGVLLGKSYIKNKHIVLPL